MLLEDTSYIFFYSGTQIPSSYCSAKKKKSIILKHAGCYIFILTSTKRKEVKNHVHNILMQRTRMVTSLFVHLPLAKPNQAHLCARQPGLDGHLFSSNSDWAWNSSNSSKRKDLRYESEAINHLCLTRTLSFTFAWY